MVETELTWLWVLIGTCGGFVLGYWRALRNQEIEEGDE